jgi:hypothetical protein
MFNAQVSANVRKTKKNATNASKALKSEEIN